MKGVIVVAVAIAAAAAAAVMSSRDVCWWLLMQITVTERISDTTDIWRLEFSSLQPEDFGVYYCEARNELNFDVAETTLSR